MTIMKSLALSSLLFQTWKRYTLFHTQGVGVGARVPKLGNARSVPKSAATNTIHLFLIQLPSFPAVRMMRTRQKPCEDLHDLQSHSTPVQLRNQSRELPVFAACSALIQPQKAKSPGFHAGAF